jgi:uncharacterized membrane protein
MRTLLIVVAAVVAVLILLIVIVLAIGSRLNPNHVASRSIVLHRSPDDVYAVVRDFAQHPKWRKDMKSVEVLGVIDGHLQFRENGGRDAVTYEVLEDVAGQRLVTRIVNRDLGYSGSWEYVFAPAANGSRLTITEKGEVSNPLFRFMSRYIFGHTATIDTYLTSLAQHFGEKGQSEDGASAK